MIPDIKKILYATDLSKNARYAFGYAVSLANRYNAKITVLHVVEELSPFARTIAEDILGEKRLTNITLEKESEIISDLRSRLEEFCNDVSREQPRCPFVIEIITVVTGHPVEQIISHIEKMDADFIVMGSRGQGVLSDVTMGSTSRRVLRRCDKPVLIVRFPREMKD